MASGWHWRWAATTFVAWLLMTGAGLKIGLENAASAAEPTLQEVLENGLKARRPTELGFIARVVNSVDNGRLSEDLVEGTMVWARRQHARPFPYFQRAIRELARRRGVRL